MFMDSTASNSPLFSLLVQRNEARLNAKPAEDFHSPLWCSHAARRPFIPFQVCVSGGVG